MKKGQLQAYWDKNPNAKALWVAKRKATMLARYNRVAGSEESIKQAVVSRKATCLKRYGVDSYSKTEQFRSSVARVLQTDAAKEKRNTVMIERYDCTVPIQNKTIHNRIKQTNLRKYGSNVASSNTATKSKIIKTNMQKYGVTCSLLNPNIREKINDTNMCRYGTIYPAQNEGIKKKTRDTTTRRYGKPYVMQVDAFKKRQRQTLVNHYGVEYPAQNAEIRQRMSDTNMEKYGTINYSFTDDFKNKISQKWDDRMHSTRERFNILFNAGLSNPAIAIETGVARSTVRKYADKNNIAYNTHKSSLEDIVTTHLMNAFPTLNVVHNTRKVIKPKEIDIYLPELRTGIEIHGLYWHSEFRHAKSYHKDKWELATKNGIRLIQLFEHEVTDRHLTILLSMLKINTSDCVTIHARKTKIRTLSNKECADFMDQNHWQGSLGRAGVRLGLFDGDQLVQAATFGKSRFNQNEWELLRSATVLNTRVVGGFSKLLADFRRIQPNVQLISFTDNRFFNGDSLKKVGFERVNTGIVGYFWTDVQMHIIPRYQSMKHKLQKLLGDQFNPALSETENMHNAGYWRVFDAGQSKWVMRVV